MMVPKTSKDVINEYFVSAKTEVKQMVWRWNIYIIIFCILYFDLSVYWILLPY